MRARTPLRVALVHDWLLRLRGGERVLDELVGMFPGAHLYTLIHRPHATTERIDTLKIVASPISQLPFVGNYYRLLAPAFPALIERFFLRDYDLVVSSSHSFAKGIRVSANTPHLCYCHTPMRYVWGLEDAYLGSGIRRQLAAPFLKRLRQWDRRTSSVDRITRVVSNSRFVAERIRRAWDRDATIVHPGIQVERFSARESREDFFLMVGGFVPYKAERLAIEAFRALGLPLVVVGDGPTRRSVQSTAPSNTTFIGRVSDSRLAELYARCRALVYPQEEDFGLIALEAQAAGAPVIAYGRGGALETIISTDNTERPPTGVFFPTQTPESLIEAVERFERIRPSLTPDACRANAERFTTAAFRRGMAAEIQAVLS